MRNRAIYFISMVLLGYIHSACSSIQFTKRYKSIQFNQCVNPDDYVKIQGFSIGVNKLTTDKTIFDLSDRGQKEIIAQTSEKSKSNQELFSQLSKNFIETVEKTNEITNTKFKKRLVIYAQNLKNDNGANRIDSYNVDIIIPGKNRELIKFAYWDKIVTEYQEIDIGKISYSKTGSFSISPEITSSGTIKGKIPINASISKAIGEEVSLKKKFASISGVISDTLLSIYRYSSPLEDINGNILIELSINVENKADKTFHEFESLFIDNKPNKNSADIKVRKINYQFPNITPEDSEVELFYKFYFREVVKGAKSFTEADDKVSLLSGECRYPVKIRLLNEEDLIKNFWLLKIGRQVLTLKSDVQTPETIRFESYAKADLFLQWLLYSNSVKVGNFGIGKGLNDLTVNEIPLIQIEIEN